jgi:hypothetical protein
LKKSLPILLATAVLMAAMAAIGVRPANAADGNSVTVSVPAYAIGDTVFNCKVTRTQLDINNASDYEVCKVSGDILGFVAGTFSGSPSGVLPPFGSRRWASDFDGLVATSWTIKMTDADPGDNDRDGDADDFFVMRVWANYDTTPAPPAVTPQMTSHANNIGGCASQPVMRAGGTKGIYVSLDQGYLAAMSYQGVSFTAAYYVQGTGLTCDIPAGFQYSGSMVTGDGTPNLADPSANIYQLYTP